MRTPFTGCGTALVTPFTSSGAVDEAAVRRLARRQIEAGVHFLVPCGTTGEAPTLSRRGEAARGRARGRGGGGPRARCSPARAATTRARWSRRRARCTAAGADGLLSVTPYYNKPTPEGLFRHYQAIAEATPLPDRRLQRAGAHRLQRRPRRPSRASPRSRRVVGVKEASGNMTQICEVLPRRARRSFLVLSGDDALTLPAMAVGARGVDLGGLERGARRDGAARRGGREATTSPSRGRSTHRLLPLMLANFAESNPIPVKAAMALMGLLEETLPAAHGPAARRRRARSSPACSPSVGLVPAGARA